MLQEQRKNMPNTERRYEKNKEIVWVVNAYERVEVYVPIQQ